MAVKDLPSTPVVALSGGIASGKSTAALMLREAVPGLFFFDADACVRRLLAEDEEVVEEVVSSFGEVVRDPEGGADRAALRAVVFGDERARKALEAVLHPRVREECLASARLARQTAAPLFLAEIPLLFESDHDFGRDISVLVATSRATQVRRLKARNGFEDALIDSILAAQMPMEEKIRKADVVLWNEGPQPVLKAQIRQFLQTISR